MAGHRDRNGRCWSEPISPATGAVLGDRRDFRTVVVRVALPPTVRMLALGSSSSRSS